MSATWSSVRLGDVLELQRRWLRPDPEELYVEIGIRSYGRGVFHKQPVSGLSLGDKRVLRIMPGDLVFMNIFAWEGAVAVAGEQDSGTIGSHRFVTMTVRDGRVDPLFLQRYFQTVEGRALLLRVSPGSAGRNRTMSIEGLLNEIVALPPLAEQRRIVARLDALAAKVEEAKGLSAEAEARHDALFMSQIDRLFTPRAGWTIRSVEELCGDPQYGFTESASREEVGPKFLRITDIQDGNVRWGSVPYCRCPDPTPYLLRPGDIMFARTGGTTGKSFLINECPAAVFASYLIRLRVREVVSPEYLYWFFQTPTYWRQIVEGSVGTGQANVNGTKLRALRVPVAPTAEQRELVARVRRLHDLTKTAKQTAAQATTRINALLPASLDRAFAGAL